MKKKLLIFDLDGVLFDTKKNMRLAWKETSKKFNLNISFAKYSKCIGMPFLEILKNLGVKPDLRIYKYFKSVSLKHLDKTKPFKNVKKQLNKLRKHNIKFSIVTSKDFKRTKFLLKKYGIKPNTLHCPNYTLRGKPHPDHLLQSIKKNNVKKKDCCFFGDTKIDYIAARKANIDFVFVKYGYGINSNKYAISITQFTEINKFI